MVPRKKPRLAYTSRRGPTHDGGGGGGGGDVWEDRLTALPDTLRLHILSLVPLKSAIRASSLSSEWRGLWRYRWPQVALGDIGLVPSSSCSSPADFVAFADSVLLGRALDSRLDALAIALPPGRRYNNELDRWLRRAAACGVVDLSIGLFDPVPPISCCSSSRVRRKDAASSVVWFESICEFRGLVHLAISGVRLQRPLYPVSLSLEVLTLHDSQIASSALKKLVHFCPSLRSLELKKCRKLREISIVNKRHRFESLTILDCQEVSSITVRVPALRRFRFRGKFLPSYRLADVDGLKDVYMSAGCTENLPRGKFVWNLGKLLDIKVLSLCNFALQIAISNATAIALEKIKKLTELQLIMRMLTRSNLSDIYCFFWLCDCDKLEKLFVELPTSTRDPSVHMYFPAAEEEPAPPKMDFANLRMIKISNFKGHPNEMELLEFLLGNAGSLEILLVVSPPELRMDEKCKKSLKFINLQLSLVKRASQCAKVILKEYDDLQFLPVHSEV